MESPISIFWDIENCGVPKAASPASISRHVKAALAKVHFNGSVSFSAVGDMSVVPHNVKKSLQQTGIILHDVPGGGEKNATDFVLLTHLFLWALEHPPPAVIMVISNDKDFSPALHGLKLKGYEILGASISGCSGDGINGAATHFWDWTTLALGDDPEPNTNQTTFFPTFQAQRAPDRAPVHSRIIWPPRVTLRSQEKMKRKTFDKSASLEDIRHWLETRFPSQETSGEGVTLNTFNNWFVWDTGKEVQCKTLGCKSMERVMRHFPNLIRITNDRPKRILVVGRAREGYGDPDAHSMLCEGVNNSVNKKRKRVVIGKAPSRDQRNRSEYVVGSRRRANYFRRASIE